MSSIVLHFAGHSPEKLKKILDPKIIDRALVTAMNKATGKARTTVKQTAGKLYTLKQGDINKRGRVLKRGNLTRILHYKASGEGLEKFSHGQKMVKRGNRKYPTVTVKVKKDGPRKLIAGSFKGRAQFGDGEGGKNNGLKAFVRKGETRLKIRKLIGPSVPHMVAKKLVVDAAEKRFTDEVGIEFERAIKFHMSKAL